VIAHDRASHECPIPGCGISVPYGRLLCLKHWHRVPRSIQARVYSTYRSWLANKADSARLDALTDAQQAAISAVLAVDGLPAEATV